MLRWESDTRYYCANLQRDLFGNLCVVYSYGGLGSRLGRIRTIPCESIEEARLVLRKIFKRRKAHNYKLFPDKA